LPRDLLRLRVPALGEVPQALALPAPDHGDEPLPREDLEHQSHLARAPPLVPVLADATRVRLDLPREQRAAALELAEDVALEARVLAQERLPVGRRQAARSEEHTSELQSLAY